MTLTDFSELPGSARLWCFGTDRPPGSRETARLLDEMRLFLRDWTAHRESLVAAYDWRCQRFLLVAVDESAAPASGCSIDALLRDLKGLEEELDLRLTDGSPVWFRDPEDEGRIRCVGRPEFRDLASRGRVGPRTTVFDLTVDRVAELRAGNWELPAASSWHARLLPDSDPAASSSEG